MIFEGELIHQRLERMPYHYYSLPNGELVVTITEWRPRGNRQEIGWQTTLPFRRRGYASAALRHFDSMVAPQLEFPIFAAIQDRNLASQRTARRAGWIHGFRQVPAYGIPFTLWTPCPRVRHPATHTSHESMVA